MINNILSTVANDIEAIDFSKSEDYVIDKLYKFSESDIKNNIKWLMKHSVRYNYLNLTQELIDIVDDVGKLKNINLEYFVTSYPMLKLLIDNKIIDISFLNYIILENFIRNNDIESVDLILSQKNSVDQSVINSLNLRGMKRKMKDYLKSKNLWNR